MTVRYPLTVPLVIERRTEAGRDEYGDPLPEVFASEDAMVFAVVVGGEEPVTATMPERVRYDLTVFAPTELAISARDRVVYRGAVYEVDGDPGCWDDNPWWSPGLVSVRCNRLEG